MNAVRLRLLALVWLLMGSAQRAWADAAPASPAAPNAESPEASAFLADLTALTVTPHRLAGSNEGQRTARFLEQRLEAIGIDQVFPLDLPVWQTETVTCQLTIGEITIALYPLRPNVFVAPTTPPGGFTAPLIYAGRGEPEQYGTREVAGAIVALDYDSADNWERALAWGARAVIFLGDGDATPVQPKYAGVPSNQLRFYVPPDSQSALNLRVDHAEAKLESRVRWVRSLGRNLVAFVPGTDPGFASERHGRELLVVGSGYDSFGVVPEQSPGARRAGNVAALVEAAQRFHTAPSRRDVALIFFDNQSRAQQGARELYAALKLEHEQSERLLEEALAERSQVSAMRELLTEHGLALPATSAAERRPEAAIWLKRELTSQANYARDDLRKQLKLLRLGDRSNRASDPIQALEREVLHWDEIRRALHQDQLAQFVTERAKLAQDGSADGHAYAAAFAALVQRTLAHFDRRLAELGDEIAIHEQRRTLRRALGFDRDVDPTTIVLHAAFDFSGGGPTWGVVAGDWTNRLFSWRQARTDGDAPGYYGRLLNALAAVKSDTSSIDPRTLAEPSYGLSFAPEPFVSSGSIAGAYGIYNLSLMTGHDARPRDGHPADTLQALDWRRLQQQAREGTELIQRVADSPLLSQPAVFKSLAKNKLVGWRDGQPTGDYAALQVSGSLAENRPASGALMALWPGNKNWPKKAWSTLSEAQLTADFDAIALEPVNENGRFRVVSVREDLHVDLMTIGALFTEPGEPAAVSTMETQAQTLVNAIRVNLIVSRGGGWTQLQVFNAQPDTLQVLKATSDAPFLDNRALWGQLDAHGFFYISDQIVDADVKLFQPMGPVALGAFSSAHPFGAGVSPSFFQAGFVQAFSLTGQSATDLWRLNEERLEILRRRGVTSADLELLHYRAQAAQREAAEAPSIGARQAALTESSMLSQRIYLPLRNTMDDLVHAIVLLLLLAIPFAFALERLIVSATTVYGRIAGFAAMFLATFGLLYVLHPGFAVASTPIIIFLAFAIVLLASLVIYIISRKFRTELRAMQGHAVGLHDLAISRMATLLAAANMGMSTMRRRPTRTALTAITVVMLTFTILCFASFTNQIGVRAIYEGPVSHDTAPSILVRKLDYGELPNGVLDMLGGEAGADGLLAAHYWLVRKDVSAPRSTIARVDDGRTLSIDAVLGLPPAELSRWPALERALSSDSPGATRQVLERGEVLLPPVVRDVLELAPGDWVLLDGHRLRFSGVTEPTLLQRLRHVDQQSLLPVEAKGATNQNQGAPAQQQSEDALLLADDVSRDVVHLTGDQVAVASDVTVRALGGTLRSIALHTGQGVDPALLGRRIAELVVMPVWAASSEGVERLVLKLLTNIEGGLGLFIPLLLGGLIIFGTLLGSISDREKEIYTFSALGLGPSHVGALFFAEATVYAVIGGMGGQLLAELVGLGAARLARAGYLQPTSINYSSTNSLFAIGVVMLTVLISAVYPALRASRSANPGLARSWKMPAAEGDALVLRFPFTVSAYDITGVVSFLAEHLRRHDDAGLGDFAATSVEIRRSPGSELELRAELALAPFDLGVTQAMTLTAVSSEIEGVDEVAIAIRRHSGTAGDWYRANRVFIRNLRQQFLLWRTLSGELIERYRLETLQALGANQAAAQPGTPGPA